MKLRTYFLLCLLALFSGRTVAQNSVLRTLTGAVVTGKNEAVVDVTVIARSASGERKIVTDAEGRFRLQVPNEAITLRVEGRNIAERELTISTGDKADNLRIEVEYVIPKIHDGLVISASQLDPAIDRRNETIYRDTLFSRDDQVFHTLDSGINAGQHEGGGKSLE
ncbi:MAG: carboxypeptidase-like regulatory domain-containing protein, partial [Blastocatellia bacterium]